MTEHHYEVRLENDLKDIKDRVTAIGALVATALKQSLQALEDSDGPLAHRTILEDNPINRAVEACDKACHYFVARHLPAAGHLRLISSVLRANVVLERVGDYAATLCREVIHLKEPIEDHLASEIKRIGRDSVEMFERSVKAFVEDDATLARETMILEDRIDDSFDEAYAHLVNTGETSGKSVDDLLSTLVIMSVLERVSDQAKNVCEYAVFAAEGETKKRKPVQVLFLDRSNDVLGPMTLAIARKGFPDHGVYTTAGLAPAAALDQTTADLLGRLGHETSDLVPAGREIIKPWADYKVIVCLDPDTAEVIDPAPFNTVIVTWWEVPNMMRNDDASLMEAYKVLSGYVSSLMITLRGEDFS